jgi:hypothetical protein
MTMVDKSIPSIFKEGFNQTVYIEFGQPELRLKSGSHQLDIAS